MKRIISLAFLFVLVGCQAQSSPAVFVGDISGEKGIGSATVSPAPETIPTDLPPTSEPSGDPQQIELQERFDASGILELVVRDLAGRLGTALEEVQVLSTQGIDWPDAGLGCPLPGKEYPQTVTPGYLISLAVEGMPYTYHTDQALQIILCSDEGAALPLIPVEDGLKDGIPWMPVDPIPTISK